MVFLFILNPSFVRSLDQYLTLLFISLSFVFISHLTNFCSLLCFCTYVVCIMSHFAFEKEPARFKTYDQ